MIPYYTDDAVTLYHGDCLELADAWTSADVLVTDPPYGIRWKRGANYAAMGSKPKGRASNPHPGIAGDEDVSMREAALAEWGDRPGIVFGSLHSPYPKYAHLGVWEKPGDAGVVGSVMGLRRDLEAVFFTGKWPKRSPARGSVFRSRITNSGNPFSPAGRFKHPHAKPGDLMEELITLCPPGAVADPFAGSGSTLVAAKALGRKAVGVELDERYCETAARRLAQGVLDLEGIA